LPPEWYSVIKDVVRTIFVVKYMDGVDHLGGWLERIATDRAIDVHSKLMNTDYGYYAAHMIVTLPLKVTLESWDVTTLNVPFEIQVTTQLQEGIRRLIHEHYETSQGEGLPADWRWEYKERPFAANYLGHILHYIEGQIMRVRQGQTR
jgi:ppGpp synthetase/RelA/SpoT-type nucleotidyltranferase